MAKPSVAIVGAGIAGCTSARLFAESGYQVTLFEHAKAIASEGSGNPAAMLYPRLSGDNIGSHFALAAFQYSLAFFDSLHLAKDTNGTCGLLQLGYDEPSRARIQKAASVFSTTAQMVNAAEATTLAGITCDKPGLFIKQATWLKPKLVCQQLIDHPNIRLKCNVEISTLASLKGYDHVILCNAHQASGYEQTQHLALKPVRGQVSLLAPTTESRQLKTILCSDGYISPAIEGNHSLGATFENTFDNLEITQKAHQQNLDKLSDMPNSLQGLVNTDWQGRVGLRCITPDRLPMVGGVMNTNAFGNPLPRASLKQNTLPWHTKLWVNVAHGSHGFINAPYSAYLLMRLITEQATRADLDQLARLNPNRFFLRQHGLKQLARTVATAGLSQLHFAPNRDLS